MVALDRLLEVAEYTRDEEQFDLLVDLTAVDWPKREKRFDVVLILYSFAKQERLRIKAQVGDGEPAPSISGIWPTANWLEREVYDMFGIGFLRTSQPEAPAAAGGVGRIPLAQGLRHPATGRCLGARKPGD